MRTKIQIACVACCVLLGVGVVVGCSLKNSDQQALNASVADDGSAVDERNVYTVLTMTDLAVDIADPVAMADISGYIALVRIDSIDGADNYSKVYQEFVSPYTYGRMTVLESIAGDLAIGESVRFYRLGGAVSADRYYEGLTEVEKERFDFARSNNTELMVADKIKVVDVGDIDIEAGKVYLAYLVNESAYYAEPNTYAIIGYQGGLREVQLQESNTRSSSDTKVLNNFTGEWENLSDITSSNR